MIYTPVGRLKPSKSAGWQWQYARMVDPERAIRFWLAIAVATLWVLSVGGEADANIPASSFEALPENHIARRRSRKTSFTRFLSGFQKYPSIASNGLGGMAISSQITSFTLI